MVLVYKDSDLIGKKKTKQMYIIPSAVQRVRRDLGLSSRRIAL